MSVKNNCYFLYGEDIVAINTRQKEILKRHFMGESFDVTTFDEKGTYEAYKSSLEGQSLFSEKTAVVINNPFFIKRKSQSDREENEFENFLKTLKELPKETVLIITWDGKVDKRVKNIKSLMNICTIFECSMLKASDGIEKMSFKLQKNGKKLSYEAREYLKDVLSSWSEISESLLSTECDKILLMAGNSTVISQKLLEDALPSYMNQIIFKYVDELFSKNIKAIIQNTDRVFPDVSSEIKNIGFISSQLRKIKIIKELKRVGKSSFEISKALKINSKWQMNRLLKNSNKLSENDVDNLLVDLFTFQYDKRHGQTEKTIKDVFLKFCRNGKGGNL